MEFDFTFTVQIQECETGKWEARMDNLPIRAFGTTRKVAYERFIAVYELYREYGEDWMSTILAERSEEFSDADIEMNGDPWTPGDSLF